MAMAVDVAMAKEEAVLGSQSQKTIGRIQVTSISLSVRPWLQGLPTSGETKK